MVASSLLADPNEAIQDLKRQLEGITPSLLLFFVGEDHGFETLAAGLDQAFPDAFSMGCTSCGGIGPEGLVSQGVTVFAHADLGRAAGILHRDLSSFRFSQGGELARSLLARGGWSVEELRERPQDFLLLVLSDGLSGMEDVLLPSLTHALPSVPLVGGSAGDNFCFKQTQVAMDGIPLVGGAAIALIEPKRPFHVFQTHGYVSTKRTLVPTSADPERRLIHRIDGLPAVEVLADLLGMAPSFLSGASLEVLEHNEVVFGLGGDGVFFLRSVMGLQGSSLLMGGAVEEGVVLHLMEGVELMKTTHQQLFDQCSLISKVEGALLFLCGGEFRTARVMGKLQELSRSLLFDSFPCGGFVTYGEHFGGLQLNNTITGVFFGASE